MEFGSLTELLAQAATVGGKVGESLRANIDNVVRNRELTQLIHDAPITFEIDALAWKGVDDSNLTALFEQLEFRTLKDRLKAISTTPTTVKDVQKSRSAESAPSLFGAEIASEIFTAKEADAKIASHVGPIAIAYELLDDQLQRLSLIHI